MADSKFSAMSSFSQPSPSDGVVEDVRSRLGGKKKSEWVFKPLRLKFRIKELEELYDSAVYRQRQALLIKVCILMATLSLLTLLVYLGQEKVCF